jgi:CRISPR-associated protein Cas1
MRTADAPITPALDPEDPPQTSIGRQPFQRAKGLPAPAAKLSGPQRLATYTAPNLSAVARDVERGATLKAVWRRYAATTTAPVGYVAFSLRYKKWIAEQTPRPEIAPGVSDYTPRENTAADRYWADRSDPRSSTHVLAGFGCSLKVEHGLLSSFDTGSRRSFEPTTHRLSAIVFTGSGGIITVDAIKWCTSRGIAIFVLDWQGDLVSVTLPLTPANIALRRAQFAVDPLPIARDILRQKIAASLRTGRLSEWTCEAACAQIKVARSIEALLIIEANAAINYWEQWRFSLKHKHRGWPPSWVEFASRGSPIAGSSRHATHPVNAMLNYAYGVVAGMCVRALTSIGLDPSAGFLHSDRDGRYSLAYDLMELLRPEIDEAILSWIVAHTWSRSDFPVTRSGIVRLQPALARVVVQRMTAAIPAARTQQAAEWLGEVIHSHVPTSAAMSPS